MSTAADRGFGLVGGIALLLPLSLIPPLVSPVPSRADMAPESGLLFHVQPVSSGVEWCLSPSISHCDEVVRTTTDEGPLEFVLFFMSGAAAGGVNSRIHSLHTVLTWPPAWQLVSWDGCWASDGWLDVDGATHELGLNWSGTDYFISSVYGGVVPVAQLVMNVIGPGQLGFSEAGEVVVSYDGGPTYATHPVQVFAEAGVSCGHLTAQCGYYTVCEPVFHHPELLLSAPTGGVADTTFTFLVAAFWQTCSIVVEAHAPWCTAWITTPGPWLLNVTADATELPPGTYETSIEVISSTYGVSRCLPTTFTVEGSTGTSVASWGRIKSLHR